MSKEAIKKTKGVPDSVDVHVGNRLRLRRTLLGVSQEKLASAIGLTFQQIQKYEKGLNRISAGKLYQLSKVLDISVQYFYDNITQASNNSKAGLADNPQDTFKYAPDNDKDILEQKETHDLLKVYYSIEDENTRKDILKFIKSMAQKIQ